ncbi:hypothetical protein G4Z05_12410 [Bacillus thermocopriae]|uniref:Uncharacterized protein n=1 Tax=Neobacillus thermocopriae TaxID=1215031 RepID=A0A6B3TTJ1_9BACI|nr:hypothetical protein [Neobacillus thermocopriae]NEX79659.1 hypothetical protein [Neobacillus thermocopriae]
MQIIHHLYQSDLVLLSIFIAILGACSAIHVANQLSSTMNKRIYWLITSSCNGY